MCCVCASVFSLPIGITHLLYVGSNCAERASGEAGLLKASPVLRMHIAVALGNTYDNVG